MGEYSGYIRSETDSTTYSWIYRSDFENYDNLYIDAREAGNILRFVNDLENYNVNVIYIP